MTLFCGFYKGKKTMDITTQGFPLSIHIWYCILKMPNHMPCHNYPLSFAKIGSGWEVSNMQFQKIFIPSHHRRDWNFLGGGGGGGGSVRPSNWLISIYQNSALNKNRLQDEALGNKPHKLCSYSPVPHAEVYFQYIEIGLLREMSEASLKYLEGCRGG